ncbi:hypothetical protein BO78DRAFT_322051 [Aspergillus sclerotiicarbonarius CBS 121057]|uniref:Ig-like domain-containing protein n=1 Tax=Aspergillus sclerotiicarbonarius (strain CBS 121057 / IBT 28362) TaxID=1448318 RepID=A0A319EJ17_ASPSB|nr:hypothetical protein BO78DRAFT_322051 [Aspergillus sclerotiicarbonarius CBS 121057]
MLFPQSTVLGLLALAATTTASTACLESISHDTIAFFSGAALTFGSNYTDATDCGLKCSTLPACQTWLFTNGGHEMKPPLHFDNTGSGPLRVPGFDGIPLEYELDLGQRFTHAACEHYNRKPIRLAAPEIQMLRLMERITEIRNWEQDVFDDATLAEWRAQASSCYASLDSETDQDVDMDLVTTRAWLWCVAELQDKAKALRDTGHVVVLDADSGVCKADQAVPEAVRHQLQDAFRHLPKSGPHDLVDPSLYMLIYGRTTVCSQGGRVPLAYPLSTPPGQTAPVHHHPLTVIAPFPRGLGHPSEALKYRQGSSCFQWLPCEVEFAESSGTAVRITSYINNLHPSNVQAYAAIEKLISGAIGPWNDVLVRGLRGRMPRRIYTYGVTNDEKPPMNQWPPEDLIPMRWDEELIRRSWSPAEWENHRVKVKDYLQLPDVDPKYRVFPPEPDDPPQTEDLLGLMTPEMWASPKSIEKMVRAKWRRVHRFSYPEPGVSYTYENWKMGKTAKPIFGPWECQSEYEPPRDHEYYSVSLEDQFRQQGLQVIVRVVSIDLTADAPHYPGDQEFHVDGMLNEHIVATAHFCYSSENITESRISYQQDDDLDIFGHQEDPFCIYKLYGLPPSPEIGEEPGVPKLQTLGSVAVTPGRFLIWSNTLRYKKHPFSLLDPSRPGHQQCVVLWLVDPHYRICSTRNVPPQQHDWWRNAVLAHSTRLSTLPRELVDMIMKETGSWPMHFSEALQYKRRSDDEREDALRAQIERFEDYWFWYHLEYC